MLSYKLDALLTYFQYSLHTISPSVTPPAVLPTVVLSWKFDVAGLANAPPYMDSQKLNAILCEPCSYTALLLPKNGLRSNHRASDF